MIERLKDNFLRFWFRFVWKYQSLIELRAYGRLQDVILRDYRTFSGKALEDYYQHKFAESGKFTKIGNWWVGVNLMALYRAIAKLRKSGKVRIEVNTLALA